MSSGALRTSSLTSRGTSQRSHVSSLLDLSLESLFKVSGKIGEKTEGFFLLTMNCINYAWFYV